MLKFLLAASICFFTLAWSAPDALACSDSACTMLVTTIQAAAGETASRPRPVLAAPGDEASLRARDLLKLEPQAPAFWSQFRSYAYKQLPTHQKENFKAVWVAMPISTSDGTVPTLGVRGSWW